MLPNFQRSIQREQTSAAAGWADLSNLRTYTRIKHITNIIYVRLNYYNINIMTWLRAVVWRDGWVVNRLNRRWRSKLFSRPARESHLTPLHIPRRITILYKNTTHQRYNRATTHGDDSYITTIICCACGSSWSFLLYPLKIIVIRARILILNAFFFGYGALERCFSVPI